MKKIILAIAILSIVLPAAAQNTRKISAYISFIQQGTIADKTIMNNPWGTGLGLEILILPAKKFSPLAELTGLAYLGGKKIGYADSTGKTLPAVEGMSNFFAGLAFKPKSTLFFSLSGGPSMVSGQTLFGMKAAAGFYFSPSQKWKGQAAYVNVFNRGQEGYKKNFVSIAFSIGMRLF